jgi:hypothetical protein
MNFAIILLCTIAAQVVLSKPAKQTREPERMDDDFAEDDQFDQRSGHGHHRSKDDEAIRASDAHERNDSFEHHQGRDEFGHHDKHDRRDDRFEHHDRDGNRFFRATRRSDGADAAITVTYVGYNTTSAATEATTEAIVETTTEPETTEGTVTETMSPIKSEDEGADAETVDTDNESSLVDLDLALLKNSQLNKIVKNQLSQAVKQSGVLGAIETAPGVEGVGSLTGGLGGLTGGLSGLTGGLSGLTGGVPGAENLNNANNVVENTSKQLKKLLEIDLNGKSLIGI